MYPANGLFTNAFCLSIAVAVLATQMPAQRALQPGRTIRATLADGQMIDGRVTGGDSVRLIIDRAGRLRELDRALLAKLSYRSHYTTPAFVLGAVGAAVGGVLGVALANAFCEGSSCGETEGRAGA